MSWMIAIACYAVLLTGVLLIAGGRRRGDRRHAAAVNELAALDVEPEPRTLRARARRAMRRVRAGAAPGRDAGRATPFS